MNWKRLARYRDLGLLVLRLGLGVAFIIHGWPKVMAGPKLWAGLGGALGIPLPFPEAWGLIAGLIELGGGLLLVLGLFFRPIAILLTLQMIAALMHHLNAGDGFNKYSHALELIFVFFGLIFIGPGRYSIDNPLFNDS